jgi:hypothetical protein
MQHKNKNKSSFQFLKGLLLCPTPYVFQIDFHQLCQRFNNVVKYFDESSIIISGTQNGS